MERQTDIRKMVRPLIPILKVGEVESTYAIRMTPLGKYELAHIKDFLEGFDDYIMCREESKKSREHYHAVIFTKDYEDDVREKIRVFLKRFFLDPPRRGDANRQYNLGEVDDLEMSIVYMLKDGDELYMSSNIDSSYVNNLKKKSYKKYSKEDFAKALEELKSNFKTENNKNVEDMMIRVVRLKSLYRQNVNMNYIYQMCISYDVHNNPEIASHYVREFLSRYQ